MTNKKILTLVSLLLVSVLLVGCMLPTKNHTPVITTNTLPVATVGTEYTATVEATDADEEDVLTYTVSGPTNMIISDAGVISGWTPATAGTVAITIAVTDSKDPVSADFTIMVIEPEPEPEIELTGIEVDPKTMSLIVGETDFFKVTANYSDETTKNVTYDCVYVSNDINIAKVLLVSPSNLQKSVKAVGEGMAKITVCYEGQKDTLMVKVNPVLLTSIVVEPETMDLLVGESKTIDSVTAHYNFGPTKNIDLKDCTVVYNPFSLTPIVITIEDNKKITAITTGKAAINVSYTEGGITERDDIVVTVIDLVQNTNTGEYYHTIQEAIDEADPGDTIEVSAGTYDGFLVNKDSITIRATGEAIIIPITQEGYDLDTGVMIDAVDVEIEGLTIDGGSREKSRGISGVTNAEYTVKNTTFTNLGTGIYANASYPAIKAELTAIGNTFTNCTAGIGGTENTNLNAIEGNIFTDCGEGIGLGNGVELVSDPDELIAYLLDNNVFVNCTGAVVDWRY